MSVSRLGSVLRQIDSLFRDGTLCGLSDRELVERFRERSQRSEAAFAGLVQRHGPMVLGVCRSVLSNPSDVDDAFQATFLVLVRRAGSVWVRDSIGPWLYHVAGRVALRARADAIRRKAREEGSASREILVVDGGLGHSERSETARLVHEELARLPERWRSPIVLCHLEGMTHEQASRSLGVPVGTVRSRLSRGRERLKDRLIRRGLAPAVAWAASGIGIGGEGSAAVVSGSLVQKTVSAGLGLASGWTLAGPVSVTTIQLTQGVLMSMFLTKAKTAALILAIGGTTMGVSMKAGGFGIGEQAAPTADAKAESGLGQGATGSKPPVPLAGSDTRVPSPKPVVATDSPRKPIQSMVRIKIFDDRNLLSSGSGTVISSKPGESIILTSASLFRMTELASRGVRKLADYPHQVQVTLYMSPPLGVENGIDGFEDLPLDGKIIDCDWSRDVGLIRIRPGRLLSWSPIAPPDWKPKTGMKMLTVGTRGGDVPASVRSTILNARIRGLNGYPDYEGIECSTAPDQTMWGGGLFTDDGYLAGVCSFDNSDARTGVYYATPKSIYQILDRNGLKHLYDRPGGKLPTQSKPAANPESNPLEKPAANPSIPPRAKTPAEAFDDWLKGAQKDLGSEHTVIWLGTLLKELEQREQALNAELQRLQKTKREVTGMLQQAEQLKKPKLPTAVAPNDALSPFDLSPPGAGRFFVKPTSPDVEGRLKDVEQKLERMLKLLEKGNASPKDSVLPTPPPAGTYPDLPNS